MSALETPAVPGRMGIRVAAFLAALWLPACGPDAPSSDAVPKDQPAAAAQPAAAPPRAAAEPPAAPPSPAAAVPAASRAPAPTAEDSAAAAREDVSPEWKMNQRNMAPYSDCMAQANSAPERIRPRLQAACANLPDAPAN
jgi:hypothetical protein